MLMIIISIPFQITGASISFAKLLLVLLVNYFLLLVLLVYTRVLRTLTSNKALCLTIYVSVLY